MPDDQRHLEMFDSVRVKKGLSCIVGCGAIGSRLALHWAELNFGPDLLIDDKCVEKWNLANQAYGIKHVGEKKVRALQSALIERFGDSEMAAIDNRFERGKLQYSYVASCVDTMEAREVILNGVVNGATKLFIDTRMNATSVSVYLLDPREPTHVDRYRRNLYPSSDVNERLGGCSTTQSVGATAQMAASLATAYMMDWLMDRKKVFEVLYDWRNRTLSTQLL